MDKKWAKINAKIQSKDSSYMPPPMPFQENVLIRDFNELYAKVYDKEKFIAA
jgi:hypothetical protein